MALVLALKKPLVLELILTVTSLGLLYSSGKIGKSTCSFTLLSYLLLTPNNFVFLRKQKPTQEVFPTTKIEIAKKSDNFEVGPATGEKYVVIGGSGFVGERIIHSLLKRGETNVVCFDIQIHAWNRQKYAGKVQFIEGDVRNEELIKSTLQGASVVFATFAVIRFFERLMKHFPRSANTNVNGMQVLVNACVSTGVKRLIVTSSSNCTFSNQIRQYDDHLPYCNKNNAITLYGLSKALSEEIALKANGKGSLAVGSIRPVRLIVFLFLLRFTKL
jgi:hypothetical protein